MTGKFVLGERNSIKLSNIIVSLLRIENLFGTTIHFYDIIWNKVIKFNTILKNVPSSHKTDWNLAQ